MKNYHIDVWQGESIWSWKGKASSDEEACDAARAVLNNDWGCNYETWDDLAEDMHGTAVMYDTEKDYFDNVTAYDAELNRLEIPPNGDDYNAIMRLLAGEPLVPPTAEGR